jgi:hypothetical protein
MNFTFADATNERIYESGLSNKIVIGPRYREILPAGPDQLPQLD